MWNKPGVSYTNRDHFSVEFCQQIQDIYGRGYGIRDSVFCMGLNVYQGLTRSQLANESPFHTRADVPKCTYFRNYYSNHEGSPIITHTIREAAQAILTFAKEVNQHVLEILGRSTGDRFILTCGDTYQQYKVIEEQKVVIKRRMIGGINCVGFASAAHKDTCDWISKQQMEDMLNNDNDLGDTRLLKVKQYFQQIQDTTRMGMTTTCGYNHCGSTKGMDVVAKFAVAGFSMNLYHHTVHHFHAFAFPHLTFAPILVGKKCVRLSNVGYKEPFLILGWGSCGGKKEAEANREPIQPAPEPQQPQATRVSRSSTRAYGFDVRDALINNVGNDGRPPSPPPPRLTTNSTSVTDRIMATGDTRQEMSIARLTATARTTHLNTFTLVLPGHLTTLRFGTLSRSMNNAVFVVNPGTHLQLRNRVQVGDIIVSVDGIIAANNADAIRSISPRSTLVIKRLNRSITSTANDVVDSL
mmetsp:Transcript_21054/g.22478  ORF Transcript_21054/g.22478 Transcript_21054/m.22478 type:complete len:468 (+) Transcript_21054:744-2147(+)